MKKIIKFFDKLEDHIRITLSHYPILYSSIGSIGIILLWRGIWVIADDAALSGWASILISLPLLLATGLFVSFFIGDQILISGIRHEKKIADKESQEIEEEIHLTKDAIIKLNSIEKRLLEIESKK